MAKGRKTGGRVRGTPNKITAEIRLAAQRLFDAAYFTAVKTRLDIGTLAPAVECKLLAYAYGEPRQSLTVDGQLQMVARVVHEHR